MTERKQLKTSAENRGASGELIDELLDCPFCGREAEHIHIYAGEEIVRCVSECCHVRPSVRDADPQVAYALWNQRLPAPPSQAENRGEEADKRDAERWRLLKSVAHHSYNQKVISNAQSASLMKEHFITAHATSWSELEAHFDAAIKAKGAQRD